MLNILEKFVVSKGYTYFRLDGSTPVASRQGLIKKYNQVKVESVVVVIWRSFTAVNRELKDDVTRDDSQQRFWRNTALQSCCGIVSNGCSIVPTLQRCVAVKIVDANRHV